MKTNEYSRINEIPKGKAKDNYLDACLVLEGGALRGLYSAGVCDALMVNDINISCVIGTSAGALIGGNYISGNIGRSARVNLKFRHNKHYIGLPALIENKGLFGFNLILYGYEKYEPLFKDHFDDPKRRLIACTTCLETGKTEYFEKGKCSDIFKALQASASMPYVSKPIEIDGKHYLDGGCTCKIPYRYAFDLGYKKVIVVRTRDLNYRKKINDMKKENAFIYHNYPNFAQSLNHMNEGYNMQAEELIKLSKEKKILMLAPDSPVTIGRVESDVEKLGDLYFRGYNDGLKFVDEIKKYLGDKK